MSLILLGLSTLQKNKGQVPLCTLPIRNNVCGSDHSCHFKPNAKEILDSFALIANENIINSFAMPQKWFCNEFIILTLRRIEEESKQLHDPLNAFFQKQNTTNIPLPDDGKLHTTKKVDIIEKEVTSKNSMQEIFNYLEDNSFMCYYALSKKMEDENNNKGFKMLVCYQEANSNFIPNSSIKVIFDIIYYLNGRVEIIDSIISKDEERTFERIVRFERSIEN